MATVELKKLRKANHPLARAMRSLTPMSTFFREFVKHPAMIGSVIPSSPALVRATLAPVDWSSARLFVEYGPGVGTFTRPVLEMLRPDAMLLSIDTNRDFVRYLNADIADVRFRAVHGSAADVRKIIAEHGFTEADYILSGLPFSTLPSGVGELIAAETEAALRPGGAFLVYQYSNYIRKILYPCFARVEQGFEWLNIPPCRIFWSYKQEALAKAA
ncbi:methyltransferase [Sphingobium phenoxybenzoativorans]|uniref:class I SAM-dependent methyltransferase n=1 Tax=Sphingobium phenoxybenzoativorans TaxID=1592790 RepID=UPI0008720627